MVIIAGIIGLLMLGFLLAIFLGIMVVVSQSQAKNKAKRMLAGGQIANPREYRQVLKILSTIPNDLEAADLYKKLAEMKVK